MKKFITRLHARQSQFLDLAFRLDATGYNEGAPGWIENHPGSIKNFVQIFWTIRGCGEFTFPGHREYVHANEAIFRYPGEDHIHRSCDPASPWCYYWVTFDGPGAEPLMRSFGYPQSPLAAGACPIRIFSEFETLLREPTLYAQRHALSLLTELLARMGERQMEPEQDTPLQWAMAQIQTRFQDPALSISALAAERGIHRTTLNRLFEETFGMSPGRYLSQLRLQRALTLLIETRLQNKEIADACGIADESYFCRLIREATGLPPVQYRKRHQ